MTTVHEAFEQAVKDAAPGRVAVRFLGEELGYVELNARANRLARTLRDRGVGLETPVGICMERSLDMMVALLAILKAGGSYVALDPKQPRSRHALLLHDGGIDVVLTQPSLREPFEGLAASVIVEHPAAGDPALDADLGIAVGPEHVAYVAYTSGSTGKPKGVAVPHRAVLRLVRDPNYLSVSSDDVVLQFAPIAFDASTLEIWAPLLHGARLVVFPPGEPSLDELANVIHDEAITIAWLTAGLFHQMVEGPIERLAGLRYLLAGGDVLSVPHVNRAVAALPKTRLVNGYGPTENTTFTCCHVISRAVETDSVPVGVPITGTRVYVLDAELQPVPDGEVGELCAGGEGVARGYANQPDLTAERFVPDPFDGAPGARMYRTGDLVRRNADGVFEFVGRSDGQVKVRGFRIELGEIESAMRADPELGDVAVVAPKHARTGRRLVAFFVSEHEIAVPQLRRRLAASLPPYMVPSSFVRLESLPLTRNGKVDRTALEARTIRDRPDVGVAFRAAQGDMEEWLAALWADLLEVGEVGVDDDFFELGGHSLMASEITRQIAMEHDVSIRARHFYQNATVAELARLVQSMSERKPAPAGAAALP
ncbi:non-ribosomal peptide synthetase [Pendulispora brunnea]|uniref:Non-ribosomal peptide synthetase n=1 Tax=Pendulispora brunnea TaxID=2905690 RepID=A0ABZ2KL08_9BACT